jgi:beta-lactamase class A
MSLGDLCAAALKESDNSAANLLLRTLGGPEAFNTFVRRCGDSSTRLDRYEPDLNIASVDDDRDTTTPAVMAQLAHRLFFGDVLSYQSRGMLLRWNGNMIPGRRRAAADEPPESPRPRDHLGVVNSELWSFDSSVEHERLTVASFICGGNSTPLAREAAHAAVGQLIIASLNTPPRPPDPFP